MLNFAPASDAKRAYLDLYYGKKQKKPFVDYVEFQKKQ